MIETMTFPTYDVELTKANARRLLVNYAKFERLAKASQHTRLITTMSIDPHNRGDSRHSKIENATEKAIHAQEVIKNIHSALEVLSETSHRRLMNKFIRPTSLYDYVIYTDENISSSTYYREIERALIEFAECYNFGELLEYT